MANYNIVIDTSNFKPFDINPALTILGAYAEKRRKDLEIYDVLALLLGELATAVQGNKITKEIWDNYNGDLQAAMSDFAQGSSQATGRALSAMRLRYFRDIVPIERARAAMLKNLDAIRAKDDGSLIHEDLGNLDYYYQHPDYVPRMYDAKLLRTLVETIMSNIAKGMVSMDKLGDLDPYTYKIITRTGFNPKDILAAMANYLATGDTKNPIMQGVLDAVWDSTFSGWNMTDEIRKKGRNWMAQGIPAGSDSKVEHIENWGARENKRLADDLYKAKFESNLRMREEAVKAEHAAKAKAAENADKQREALLNKTRLLNPDAVDTITGNDAINTLQKKQKTLLEGMARALQIGYITKNAKGEYVVTKKGVDAYNNTPNNMLDPAYPSPTTGGWNPGRTVSKNGTVDFTWKSFVDEVLQPTGNVEKAFGSKAYMREGSGVFTRRWSRVVKDVERSIADPEAYNNAYTVSGRTINMGNLTEGLKSISGTTHIAKWDSKKKTWVSTGKVFDANDLEDAKGKLLVGVNENGVYYKYRNNKGELQVLVPSDGNYLHHNIRAADATAAYLRASMDATFKSLYSAIAAGDRALAKRLETKINQYIYKYNNTPGVPANGKIPPINIDNMQLSEQDLANIESAALQDNAAIYDFLSSLEAKSNILEDTNQFNSQK